MLPLTRMRERGPGGEGLPGSTPAPTLESPLAAVRGEGARGRGGLRLALLLLAAVLAATATMFGRQRTPAAPPISSNVIAVLPFSYHGSGESRALEEGIVRLLSTNLDGAGELRSVDARALLSVVEHTGADISDPTSGRALAERFGAGLYVLGHIVEAGGRLRITAVIYERTGPPGGAPLEQVTVEGESEQLFPLVDELTTKLLAHRSREPRVRIAQLAALTTNSLSALRSFLDGEQHYRRGRYGEAVEAFRQAVRLDSTFALAYYRMSTAAIWVSDWEAEKAGRRGAMRFRERLAPRDRQVVEAWDRYSRAPTAEVEQLYEMLIARNPDDVEAWFQLGEARFHWKPMLGYPVLEAREPFERVLSYEPNNAAALIHLLRLAAIERDTARFDALFERVRRLDPSWDQLLELEALHAYTFGDRAAQAQLRHRLAAVDAEVRVRILNSVATYTGDLEGTAELARQLSGLASEPRWTAAMHILLAQLEVGRGRWHAASEELAALERLRPSWATHQRGALGTLPFLRLSAAELEAIRSDIARMTTSSANPLVDAEWDQPAVMYAPGQLYLLGLLSVRRGDPVAALRYAGELERQTAPVDAEHGQIFAQLLRAEVARAGGQMADALRAIGETPLSAGTMSTVSWRLANAHERFLRAELLQALGRDEEALQRYASFPAPSAYDLHYLAPSHLHRAEIYERRGEKEKATEHYRRFIELWKDADPELQPLVRQARERLRYINSQVAIEK
ncbi:MAG TPA: tetratricopeptide repeat protein [Longimicrobiaceae bacterium]|nr:tetratricopeptide repeat protein [Longimicrobiaceae bacterium]